MGPRIALDESQQPNFDILYLQLKTATELINAFKRLNPDFVSDDEDEEGLILLFIIIWPLNLFILGFV